MASGRTSFRSVPLEPKAAAIALVTRAALNAEQLSFADRVQLANIFAEALQLRPPVNFGDAFAALPDAILFQPDGTPCEMTNVRTESEAVS